MIFKKKLKKRYNEIQKEILEISECFMMLKKQGLSPMYNGSDANHLKLLFCRLSNLIKELKDISSHGIEIPLVYKKMVNDLFKEMKTYIPYESRTELEEENISNVTL
jgi:hypothetical protein